jgi:hypothetical protein
MQRIHRERLIKNGFIREVIKGWYIPSRPDESAGETTSWYAYFWDFCAAYLNELKKDDWCISPEQSIALHTENHTVPRQLLIRSIKARNNITQLLYGTSLLDIRAALPDSANIEIKNGIRMFSLAAALIASPAAAYRQNPVDMRAAISLIRDASELLGILLEGGHSTIAGRLAGAFRNAGRPGIADEILTTMRSAGYEIRESDPFDKLSATIVQHKRESPFVLRMQLMWSDLRESIIEIFPEPPGLPRKKAIFLKYMDEAYISDAYHSLSIEGYQVTTDLIARVRRGEWNPDKNKKDRESVNAVAARGYWQSYQTVRNSIELIIKGANAGEVAETDHRIWYREMFSPGVIAGIYKASDLAGYRSSQVFIRQSMHIPPSAGSVRDAMPALFDLLRYETNAGVRSVLGHFFFVYIHPYPDGNGRMGRFLMNAMLASGGYPWTIVPFDRRSEYMAALEDASAGRIIKPFAKFIASLVRDAMAAREAKSAQSKTGDL